MLRPYLRRVNPGPDPGDAIAIDQNRRVLKDLHRGHFAPAAGAGRPATRHDLTRADQQGLQSRSSIMGKRM